ncbi:hypothetical protein [Kribbella sp. NPDC051718]|uniref:hypothetical protein n=1 Tax=Kribbella sp. NPDC051718 TaxID=3155168 RepID=UPI003445D936
MKPLDELVKAVAPVFGAAGFRKSGRRYLLMPPAGDPGNAVLATFAPFTGDPAKVGFHLEWAVIPSAGFAFHAGSKSPSVTWGVIADRVPAPPAFVTGSASELWSYPISEGPDRCAAAVTEVLTGGLLDRLLSFQDRAQVLRAIDEGTLGTGLPTEIPRGRPWRYLSMHIDDGNPTELETMLDQLHGAPPGNPFAAWWRERLAARS